MNFAKKSLPIDNINIFSYFFFVKYFRRPKQKVGHPGVLRMDFPARFFVNNSISVHFNVDWGFGIGLAHCIHKVFKLRWKSGLKSPESWSNVTEVGTEVLLGPNLGDILADFDQGSGSRPPRLPPQFGDLWMQCANPMSKPQSTLKWTEIELLTKNRANRKYGE